jgi:hypothetical protein
MITKIVEVLLMADFKIDAVSIFIMEINLLVCIKMDDQMVKDQYFIKILYLLVILDKNMRLPHILEIFFKEEEKGMVKWYGGTEVFSLVNGKMIKDIKDK